MGRIALSKILLVTGIYPPDIGGPASHFHELVKYLNETKKINFRLITLTDSKKSKDDKCFYVNRKIKNPIRFILVVIKIAYLSIDSKLIYSGGLYLESFIASLLTGKSLVYRVVGDPVWERARNNNQTELGIDEFQTHESRTFSIKLERGLFNYIFKRAKIIVTPSDYLKKIIYGWGVDKKKIRLIPNAVDINQKDNFEPQKKYDLVTVCRLVSWKGVGELVEISRKLNLKLAIVGDGPERQELESEAKKYGDKAVFFGRLEKDSTVDVLHSSKIFFLNSSYEGLPHSLLEAMSLGIPCIVTETGGSKAVITNNYDGILVPVNGLEKKISELTKLINNKNIQSKISKNAVLTIRENYSLDKLMSRLMAIFLNK